ncbi:MAG: efflux RND transporter permease subunit [Lachnospiraceae bacterium]|nr:efflux RND transporter permease subunit [Lachnospiraceae bacterium]
MKTMIAGIIKRPVTAIVAIISLVVFAAVSLTSMQLKLMPDMSIPVLGILTSYPGASPDQIDERVTDPISDACESITGVKHIQADSMENMSQVILQLDYGVDIQEVKNDVRTKLDKIKNDLPEKANDPTLLEASFSGMADMTISVASDNPDEDILEMVKDNIEPEFQKITTLAEVSTKGGREKYISVELVPEYAAQYGMSVSSIVDAIKAVNFSMSTGTAAFGDQKMSMNAEVKYEDIAEIEQIPITTSTGQTIHLSDVSRVRFANKDATSLSRYNDQDNVSVSLKKKQSASPVTLSNEVKKKIADLELMYPNLTFEIISDQSETIIKSLSEVFKTIVQAVFLAMIVLFIFFGDLKASLIVASTMPVSLLATLCCMKLANFDLNTVTAGSLIIAVGMMTDNAVVVLEMCFRKKDEGLDYHDAALMGAVIVANSVITSTITTVVVYLPMALLEGLSGQMFKPMGFTIIFALTASMIAALLLIPLCFASYKPVEKKDILTNRILARVVVVYEKVLRRALKFKKTVLLIVVLMVGATIALTPMLQTELYTSQDEGIVSINVTFRPNLNIEAMNENVEKLEEFVRNSPDIKKYITSVEESSSSATIDAYKADECDKKTQEIVDEWNVQLKDFSNICEITCSAGSSSGGMTSADTTDIVLQSTNLDKLKADAEAIEDKLKEIDGVISTTSSVKDSGSKVKVVIDPVLARSKGFSAQQVAQLIYTNMNGSNALDVDLDGKTYTITVEYPKGYYESVGDVESMSFLDKNGNSVPLTEMGEVTYASAPQSLTRNDGMYKATITARTTSDKKDFVTKEANRISEEFELDPEVIHGMDMEQEMEQEEFSALGMAIAIAVFLVFVVMALMFNSISISLLIMLEIPFAIVGSILYMIITQSKISMVSLMGFLMLAGIVVNNGIILIDMAIQNRDNGMDVYEALVDSGKGRLRPILMTTLTTILAMIPTSLGIGGAADSMQGMAVVIVGGLLVSTVLTLVVLPTFYLLLDSGKSKFAALGRRISEKSAARALAKQEKRALKEEQKRALIEEKSEKTKEPEKEDKD